MHPCMFYVSSIVFQHYMYVHVHGASFPEVFDGLVVSSSPVRGSRTLQCGIREKFAAWASMGREDVVTEPSLQHWASEGHEDQLAEAGFPLPSRDQKL